MNLARRLARRLPPTATGLALLLLLAAAFGLRVFGFQWDDGQYLHPDERHVVDVLSGRIFLDWPPSIDLLLDPARSGLNPRSADPDTGAFRTFAYGALPLFTTNAIAAVVGLWSDRSWDAYGSAHLIGRALSALFDTLTVLVVFGIGRRLFGNRVALLAAAFAALAPMSIQLAHFFTTDSWLTFFVACSLWSAILAAESGSTRWFAVTGMLFGLAMATKGSVFTLAGVIVAAVVYQVWRRSQAAPMSRGLIAASLGQLAAAAAAAMATFALFEPYALLKPDVYLRSIFEQAEIVSGSFDVPFTRHYVGTTPVLYQGEQLVRWGFGPVAGILSLLGVVLIGRRFWRERTAGQWLLLTWLLGYGLVIAIAEAKFLRYLAPLTPVLAVSAGLALDVVWRWTDRTAGRAVGRVVGVALLAGAALWTAAFTSIYAHDNTRLAASRWILANVPSGSALSDDYWDDALPLSLGPGLAGVERQYDTVEIDLYADREPSEVADEIYEMLQAVDYVVLSSNRVAAAMPQSPWRYPVQARYYDLLAEERLGFDLVAEFARPPSLGPLRFVDSDADESFINYDHPRVLIFGKTRPLPRPEFDRLMAWSVARPWSPTRAAPPERSLTLDAPVGDLPIVDDARWSAGLTDHSAVAAVVWVCLLALLQIAGWPLAALLFSGFADAGWGFARLTTLLAGGYLVWIGASTEAIAFRAIWTAAAVAAVGGLGWIAWGRRRLRRRFVRFTPDQRRNAIGAEVVFWSVFALFLLFRYLNPDGWHPVWGGEKPMEFAHLNATLRSAHFPPYDPWYADGYINYYYYGLYLVAFCLKLTGIPSEIGFNLAQPTVIALLASAGYTITATLGRDATRRRDSALRTGLFGTLLLVGIGNLVSIRDLLTERVGGNAFDRWVWAPSRAIPPNITEFPFFTGLYADLHAHVVALPITLLCVSLGYAVARGSAGETTLSAPTRSGDRRRATAARLLMLALALGTLSATNAWDVPVYAVLAGAALVMVTETVRRWHLRLAVVAGVGATLALTTFGLFQPFFGHYVALFGSLASVREPTPFGDVASHLGGLVAVVLVGAIASLLAVRQASYSGGVLRRPLWVVGTITALFSLRVALGDTEPDLGARLGAVIILVLALTVAAAAWTASRGVLLGERSTGGSGARTGVVAVLIAVVLLLFAERVVLAGFVALAGAGVAVWLCGVDRATRYVGFLVAAAGSVGAGTEVVVLADDLIGSDWYRMNTVFKFYNQIWVLLAIAGAGLTARMYAEATRTPPRFTQSMARGRALGVVAMREGDERPPHPTDLAQPRAPDFAHVSWARVGLGVVSIVLVASLAYPLLAIKPRLEQRFTADLGSGTLNAMDWMRYGSLPVVGADESEELSFRGDLEAIDWFNREVPGSPVVAEASIGPYRCNGSRFSIGTGLPTIIGWERHQQQQRYPDALGQRVADVETLYASADRDEKLDLLARYDVEYVVVGPLERLGISISGNDCVASPTTEGIAAFDRMVGTNLEVAFRAEQTTIYRVRSTA